VRKAFEKQTGLLVQNLRHPSLQAKKYDEAQDLWQARVTRIRKTPVSMRRDRRS